MGECPKGEGVSRLGELPFAVWCNFTPLPTCCYPDVMKPSSAVDHFNSDAALLYDERNRKLAPISECLHFLIQLGLRDLPRDARALCVGVGTGAEILKLASAFPAWTFVGVEPAKAMLDVCREELAKAGVLERCELVHGYAQDAPKGASFDVALSVFVAHFIKRQERLAFFRNMTDRLKPGGHLVNAEISYDLDARDYPAMLNNWASVQELMGATPESIANLPRVLREMLSILPPHETEEILRASGISTPSRIFQAFMITGWIGQKSAD
jgi:tRNA (cmo5U34)-methyltransferase